MNIHEYQAKKVLAKYGVPTPTGSVALSKDEIKNAVDSIKTPVKVVKAQIHAGGRGKAGGVKVTKSAEEAILEAEKMFGVTLVTHQTGKEGQEVKRVYIEEGSNIEKEYYLSAVVDRDVNMITFIGSQEGGMEIEEVAESSPEKIIKVSVDMAIGIQAFHARKLAFALGFDTTKVKKFVKLMFSIYEAFVSTDASQLEINPLIVTSEGDFMALDAKFNFDDNALYRQKEISELRDEDEENPLERRATEHELNYIKMDGKIGCMVNGAGLAMATMDIIKLYGSEPANFLDVGGGATRERVTEAFKIIMSDNNVEAILVNIFGGIMRCDVIAEGIVAAAKDLDMKIPLVVRLAGTNFEIGKKILKESGLAIIAADDLADAAQKVVDSVK